VREHVLLQVHELLLGQVVRTFPKPVRAETGPVEMNADDR
jgi:hypothetical protein